MAMIIGSSVPLNYDTAVTLHHNLQQNLNQSIVDHNLPQDIYINNLLLCLVMFIPLLGAGSGLLILYNTGVGLNAICIVQNQNTFLGVLDLMASPVFWLEFVAYSIAIAQSIWLFRRILQGRWDELRWTAVAIVVCVVLLAVGAIVETWYITG